jgi:serine/threonine-protein kinase ULK/ATG1
MMGGLICERRTSAANVNQVAEEIKLQHNQLQLKNDESINNESGFEDYDYEYSHQLIAFGKNRFEYSDVPSKCIGHGSFGTVFKGYDFKSSKAVAIKKMNNFNVKPDELKTMQSVSSGFLVSLVDICEEQAGITHIVMELCDIDLERFLQNTSTGHLNESNLTKLIDNITRGYYALYEQRIVHRDIKPQNILITYSPTNEIGVAKITDFGVSRILVDENPGLSNVAGTLYYMAPEVGANLLTMCSYDHCVDIWSIGCVFYQSLVGKMPFDECSLCRLFLNCAGQNYEAYDMPELPENTDEKITELLTMLLEIDRKKRATPSQLYAFVCNNNLQD